jgi:hypothetical protein
MKALTLRHLRPELARAIERKAHESGTSLSGAVVTLLEQATGLAKPRRPVHHDFDRFAGSWTAEQAREFDESLARQRSIDKELWK